jgi:hypothetical protein
MTTRTVQDGENLRYGTFEEGINTFYDTSANAYIIQGDASGTVADRMVVGVSAGTIIGNASQVSVSDAPITGVTATTTTPEFQVLGTAQADSSMVLGLYSTTDALGPMLAFVKSGNATIGSQTVVADNEYIGRIVAFGSNGTDTESPVAEIRFVINGEPLTSGSDLSDMPGSIEFLTTPNASETLATAMTIEQDQSVNIKGNLLAIAGSTATDPQVLTLTTTGSSADAIIKIQTPASGTGNNLIRLEQGSGDGSADNMGYDIYYSGQDGRLAIKSRNYNGSGGAQDVIRIPDNQHTIDADATWDDNVAFDDHDDAMVLYRAFSVPHGEYLAGQGLLASRQEELIDIGVLRRYEDGWVGHNPQRMEALLAGGIYQSRERIDRNAERIDALEKELVALKAA